MLNLNLNTTSIKKGPVGPAPIPVPVVDFSASTTGPTAGDSVVFTDLSTNTPTSWEWSFPGGTPTGSTAQNPTVTYSATGSYDVTLLAGNTGGTGSLTKTDYINVQPAPAVPVEETFTSNATWSCCPGATRIEVIAVGAGGGGAAGGSRSSATVCNDRGTVGGAGGGGGGVIIAELTAAQFTPTVPIVIGVAGSGGAGVVSTNWPGTQGNIGTNGGDTCFGSYLNAGGGKTPTAGGYGGVAPGGINACPGIGGVATITVGTGTACSGGNGGGMNATNSTSINGGGASNVDGTIRTPGGGAGGSMWFCSSTLFSGNGGVGRGPNTVCGLTLGQSGNGGNAPGGVGQVSENYGAGGAGGAARLTTTGPGQVSGSGRPGRPGVVKVIQYFD